ncbi:MAG: NifB/NifX family molybdenum-iron cluster-binding protein [Candidatus Izemoplasmatales bacterium]
MKVALSTKNNMITDHFGHCDYFVVYELGDEKIISSHVIKNPPHQKGFLPKFLKDEGIDVVIAGGIGEMAVNMLKDLGIDCYINVTGEVPEVIEKYLNNDLSKDNDKKPCKGHH